MQPRIKIKNKIFQLQPRKDRAILMICIGIAFVFWFLVKLSQTFTTEKEIQFDLNIPEEKTFVMLPPVDMEVEIEGTGWDLLVEYFATAKLSLIYDLTGSDQLNRSRGQLRSDILRSLSSDDLRIKEVNHESLHLVLEDKLSKKVPIILNKELAFGPEHQLQKEVNLLPDSLTLSGPASMIADITQWETEPLIMKNLNATISPKVLLVRPAREIQLDISETTAEIVVEQFTEKSIFVPLMVKNAPDSIKIFPETIKLSCIVGLSKYNDVSIGDFIVEVDLKNIPISESRNTVPIVLTKYPDYVKNVQFSPKSAEFFILK